MATFISRAGALGGYVSAATQTVPSVARVLAVPVIAHEKPIVHVPGRKACTPESWARISPTGVPTVTSGIGGKIIVYTPIFVYVCLLGGQDPRIV